MKKTVYPINLKYTFDPTHKGAPYTLDGENWFNHGDLMEILDKACKGLKAEKDGNGKWNECSDIAETMTSVKSSKATLASDLKGDNMSEMLDRYFKEVHSNNWDFVTIINEEIVVYNMNEAEFREFTMEWAGINERKVIRYKSDSSKMIRWFEERVA